MNLIKYLLNGRLSKKQGKMNLESDTVYGDKLAIFSKPLADVQLSRLWILKVPPLQQMHQSA